jgi:hypothetical protein
MNSSKLGADPPPPTDWFLATVMLIPLACALFLKRHVYSSSSPCRYLIDLVIPNSLNFWNILNEGLVLVFGEEIPYCLKPAHYDRVE